MKSYSALWLVVAVMFVATGGIPAIGEEIAYEDFIDSYVQSDPVVFDGDFPPDLFDLPGSGTEKDPFLLSGIHIISSSFGISVRNVNLHMRIADVIIDGCDLMCTGIELVNSSNIVIEDNGIFSQTVGIGIHTSSKISVISNNFVGSNTSVSVDGNTNKIDIAYNSFFDSATAIVLDGENSLVTKNSFSSTPYSIMSNGVQNVISWNNFFDNTTSITNNGMQNDFLRNYYNNDVPAFLGTSGTQDSFPLIEPQNNLQEMILNFNLQAITSTSLGAETLMWTSYPKWNGYITYSIEYSTNGEDFIELEKDITQNRYVLDLQDLDTRSVTYQVHAHDINGFSTPSNSITIENGPSLRNLGLIALLVASLFSALSFAWIKFSDYIPYFLRSLLRLERYREAVKAILPSGLVAIVLAESSDEEKFLETLKENVSKELFAFAFLLNPYRLSIMQILYEEHAVPSFELRERLDIKWSKYTPHINSLIDKGYISQKEEFVEEKVRKVLTIEVAGLNRYRKLLQILSTFVDNSDV